MHSRCKYIGGYKAKYYALKGITVCDRWMNKDNFIADMINGFKEHLTLDRIDPAGNYEPSNCRWITRSEQNRNRDIAYNSRTTKHQYVIKNDTYDNYIDALKIACKDISVYNKHCQNPVPIRCLKMSAKSFTSSLPFCESIPLNNIDVIYG